MKIRFVIAQILLVSATVNASGGYPPLDKVPPSKPDGTKEYKITEKKATVIEACPKRRDWALTFDDGPTPETRKVLAMLKERNIKATFFVVGSRAVSYPDIMQEIRKAGHQIALHTWSHTVLTKLTEEQIIADLEWNIKAVKDTTGLSPKYMRPPEGELDDKVLKVMAAMNLVPVKWTKDTKDWSITAADESLVQKVLTTVASWQTETRIKGDISLQHDLLPNPVKAAGQIVDAIKQISGVNFVPVGACLNETKWKMWYNDVQPLPKLDPSKTTSSTPQPTPGKEPVNWDMYGDALPGQHLNSFLISAAVVLYLVLFI